MASIKTVRVAVIATDGVEESELLEPVRALKAEAAHVEILSPRRGEIQCFRHFERGVRVDADKTIAEADPGDYDALLLPGGALSADFLRADRNTLRFVQSFDKEKKPMAIICHAPWILISAGVVKDRTLTGYHTIEDDVRNAGGHWVDHEVECDFNWVTSRQPSDLPAFISAIISTCAEFTDKARYA